MTIHSELFSRKTYQSTMDIREFNQVNGITSKKTKGRPALIKIDDYYADKKVSEAGEEVSNYDA